MGFIDLSSASGRHFGSIGAAINEIATRIELTPAASFQVTGEDAERAARYGKKLCQSLRVADRLKLHVQQAIPGHIGLGSGTQLALAIGMALNAFYDLKLSVRQLASLTQRGKRSGIGIGVFEHGGLVVDGGRGPNTVIPPVLARHEVPSDWRFVLVFDRRGQGLHGAAEIDAFKALPPFPESEAQRLCYRLLMTALPALAEGDLPRFGQVVSDLQQTVGSHFAAAQGGVYASAEVAEVMAWLADQGAHGLGQTSWGPTGFAIFPDQAEADRVLAKAGQVFSHYQHIYWQCVTITNRPAWVEFA